MASLRFWFMVLVFWVRDLIRPAATVLAEIDIQPGASVLDYGCGTGVFSFAAARLVGPKGKVYAADILPVAVRRVRRIAVRKRLGNIEAIGTDCPTGLADGSIDAVLLFDTFHLLKEPQRVLAELHRLLNPRGILAFSDHHMKESKILAGMTAGGVFEAVRKGKKSYLFRKV